jgi:predicted RNA methylase
MIIQQETIEALKLIEVDGTAARIPHQLNRSLYVKVDKALSALGGKWSRKQRCHEFDEDCSSTLADAITTGEIEDPKKIFQLYETPFDLAKEMIDSLDGHGLSMLEPSAASGRIAQASVNNGHSVAAVEIQPKFKNQLDSLCQTTIIGDFLELVSGEYLKAFDAIVMNPPFCRHQDIKHVLHAWQFLRSGGQLRAIVSPSFTFEFARSGIPRMFKEFLESIKAKYEPMPAGTFKASGTMVQTMLISATKQ